MTTTSEAASTAQRLIWDNHSCMPLRPDDQSFLRQLERVHASGVTAITLNVGFGDQGVEDHIKMLASLRSYIARHPEQLTLAVSAQCIRNAMADGKLAISFDIEGMNALAGQVSLVEAYYALGVRWMLVAYNLQNLAGGGCMQDDDGLTAFGRAAVAEMNRVGMVPCGTHCGYKTARELIDISSSPTIFSHSNPRAIWDHPRNIPDDLMKACAERGGVIGINGIGIFLGNNDASIETLVRHVDYALSLVGEDHVGLALDYVFDDQEVAAYAAENPEMFPISAGYGAGMAMVAPWQIGDIAESLSKRGIDDTTLTKLLGGNHLRIAETVWRAPAI